MGPSLRKTFRAVYITGKIELRYRYRRQRDYCNAHRGVCVSPIELVVLHLVSIHEVQNY